METASGQLLSKRVLEIFKNRAELKRRNWLKMPGSTELILEKALTAPHDLQLCIALHELQGPKLRQAQAVIQCLHGILPPRPKPSDWRFLIQLGDDREFIDFHIVRKHQKAKRVSEYRAAILPLTPRDWYSGGENQLVKRFHAEFFGHTPTVVEMERFILKSCNFEIGYDDNVW